MKDKTAPPELHHSSFIIDAEDGRAGAAGGAEEPGLRQSQRGEVAEGGQLGGQCAAHSLRKPD